MQSRKVWIYAHYNQYTKEIEYQLSIYERGISSGDALVGEQEVSFETPEEKQAKLAVIAALQRELQARRAEDYKEQMEIQERINELLALEYKPEAEEVAEAEEATLKPLDDDIPF